MITKICTDIEQSKKLIKLGVDANTADMTYVSMKDYGENTYHLTVGKTDVDWAKDELGNLNWNDVYEKYIPAWSLSTLLEVIPKEQHPTLVLNAHYKWICDISNPGSFTYKPTSGDNPLDAVFKMILYLHEQKLL